jgi:uncharacterized membrane-anchored protein
MNRTTTLIGMGLAIALQLSVLLGMVGRAAVPLWTGTEIRVKTVPRDPRSMFRGNYARLNYEIGTLPKGFLEGGRRLRRGEVIYVGLEQNEDGLYRLADASLDKPAAGIFLRGRIANGYPPYRVEYGIEAFFAPKKEALQLERDLRQSGVAVLMVTDSGRVALKDVEPRKK